VGRGADGGPKATSAIRSATRTVGKAVVARGTSGKTLASMEGLGSFQFFKSTSENMYLNIYGHAFAPDFAGLVGVTYEEGVAPVGLPGSLGLLASSLVGVLLLRRTSRARTGLVPSTP